MSGVLFECLTSFIWLNDVENNYSEHKPSFAQIAVKYQAIDVHFEGVLLHMKTSRKVCEWLNDRDIITLPIDV